MGTTGLEITMMKAALLVGLISVCHAQVDDFLLGEKQGLSMPDFVVDGDLEIGGKVLESCSIGDKNARWKGSTGNKHCYMLFEEPKTWFQGKLHCESLGGYL